MFQWFSSVFHWFSSIFNVCHWFCCVFHCFFTGYHRFFPLSFYGPPRLFLWFPWCSLFSSGFHWVFYGARVHVLPVSWLADFIVVCLRLLLLFFFPTTMRLVQGPCKGERRVDAWLLYEPLSRNVKNALILAVCAKIVHMVVLRMYEPNIVVRPILSGPTDSKFTNLLDHLSKLSARRCRAQQFLKIRRWFLTQNASHLEASCHLAERSKKKNALQIACLHGTCYRTGHCR